MTARTLTLGSFIAALGLGAVVAFAPLASTGSSSATVGGGTEIVRTTTRSVSLVASQGLWVLVVIAVPIVVTLVPVLIPRRPLRIVAAVLLWIGCVLGLLSVGLFFVPSAVLMTAAAAVSSTSTTPAPI